MSIIFLIGRIILGGYFILNAWNHLIGLKQSSGYAAMKGVPMPKLATIVSGLLLLFGGLGIIFWFQIKIAFLLLIIFIIPVTFMMHQFWKIADPMQKMGERIQFQKNLAILGALLMMFAVSVF
jgi:uncharacterized membrane protein YphA (DoxX/SURF4 family)